LDPEERLARRRLWTAAWMPLLGVLLLWLLFLFDRTFDLDYAAYGVRPRDAVGARGVLFAPLVHADAEHVFDNSVALLVLGWCLVYFYPKVAGRVLLWSWLASGVMVWLTARPSLHIGASGVVYGLASFLFFSGILRRHRSVMAISLLVVFLYGSLVWGLLPIIEHISWESHLWGGVAGAVLAWVHRKVEPAHMPKPIVLEDDEEAPLEVHRPIMHDADPGDEDDTPTPLSERPRGSGRSEDEWGED